jgi:hypothetical protein
VFLAQLTEVLREESSGLEAERAPDPLVASAAPVAVRIEMAAVRHGNELLLKGFAVDQAVHDYGDLCQAVTELALVGRAGGSCAKLHTTTSGGRAKGKAVIFNREEPRRSAIRP